MDQYYCDFCHFGVW